MWSKYLVIGLSLLLLFVLLQGCDGCECEWNDIEVSWWDPTTGQSSLWVGNCGDSLSLTICPEDDICINPSVNCIPSDEPDCSWVVTGPQHYTEVGNNFPFCFEPPQDGNYLLELNGNCPCGPAAVSCPPCTLNMAVNVTPPSRDEFILIGTGPTANTLDGLGKILLYGFNSSSSSIFDSDPTMVANFTGGVVQGLAIFNYEGWGWGGDQDLDFIALVRFDTGYTAGNGSIENPTRKIWRYELYLFENAGDLKFDKRPIFNTLPQSDYAGIADCTAAEFDMGSSEKRVDFVVSIGNWTKNSTQVFKFRNTGSISNPFDQLNTTITEDWANYADRLASADFDGNKLGDFTTFDYYTQIDFSGQIGIYKRRSAPFGTAGDFDSVYCLSSPTPHSVGTIAAGEFDNGNLPDIIVGGDDDGDSGQYWLYQNAGNGFFTSAPVMVFDLNIHNEYKSDNKPGGGVAAAYDFNADDMMDVVATATAMGGSATNDTLYGTAGSPKCTTIWFIARNGSGTFWVSDPDHVSDADHGLPVPPSSIIDIIYTTECGTVSSIAAPMRTIFGVG